METRLIECKFIDVPKVTGDVRTFSKEFAVKLADSLKVDGHFNPIVVRTDPATRGRFILVAGRHRYYAINDVLREQFIRTTVIKDMDEDEASIAADVENLWRTPLNQAQQAAAVKRWHAHWMAKHSAIEPNAADKEPEGASETRFDETVAAVTGKSPVTIRRSKTVGKAFTEKQLEVFANLSVNQTDMMTVARIKDVGQRAEVVTLVASGLAVTEAVKAVRRDETPKRYNSSTASAQAAEAKAATKNVRAPELTDDEWFAANCGEKASTLGDPTKFKSDALLYRSVADLRHVFRTKGRKFVEETKKSGVTGAFYNLINHFNSISHPNDWSLCNVCDGRGTTVSTTGDKTTSECVTCVGGGYRIK